MKYSYTAFRQATLLYEDIGKESEFDDLCTTVAGHISIHSELQTLFRQIARKESVGVLVVTCGLRKVWEKVLARNDFSSQITVLGGGRVSSGFVVDPAVKGAIVSRLQNKHLMYVVAAGDSPLDLPMLEKADQAIVVVGDEAYRSKHVDEDLKAAITDGNLAKTQSQLAATYGYHECLSSLLWCGENFEVTHATEKAAAKLLQTPMRNADISSARLREAHRQVGRYLATEYLSEIIGLEECLIPHVQGGSSTGHLLEHEAKTTIVALMRGGEPMAFGVSDAFPTAMFVHAKEASDLTAQHVKGQSTVLLVDSVINNGETIVDFDKRVRALDKDIRIVAVTGVMQARVARKSGTLARQLDRFGKVDVVALRVSENKYTGKDGTDTGARLFGSVGID